MIPLSLCLVAAIQTCIQLLRLGLPSPHREARLRRRELRQKQHAEEEDLVERMKELQAANENKQRQLEAMREVLFGLRHFDLHKGEAQLWISQCPRSANFNFLKFNDILFAF